ncbi:MAG: dienelactone hydrolase family protein [Alphaproteobacteria bacterium]|nr:dienelactone hydrolase family protein [Alphaproteobacteria bacterium]
MTKNEQVIQIFIGESKLEGNLSIPDGAKGIVLFAHGSGSSRFSPRNRFVANFLVKNHLATLLIDLLTMEEEAVDELTREYRFDIGLLAERLMHVTDWLHQDKRTKELQIHYFGSSTGAAAALIAAAKKGSMISSVVSRGGRPDLASDYLTRVKSPTLLIVGVDDHVVIELNKQASDQLHCEKKIEIIPHATHLFEEPGTLEQVAHLASSWFLEHSSLTAQG